MGPCGRSECTVCLLVGSTHGCSPGNQKPVAIHKRLGQKATLENFLWAILELSLTLKQLWPISCWLLQGELSLTLKQLSRIFFWAVLELSLTLKQLRPISCWLLQGELSLTLKQLSTICFWAVLELSLTPCCFTLRLSAYLRSTSAKRRSPVESPPPVRQE